MHPLRHWNFRIVFHARLSKAKKTEKYNTIGAFRLEDGTLFGSALYVNKGVDNLHRKARLPLKTAINSATINPARYLGFDNRKGSIEIGKDADLVVCTEHIELKQVYCKGTPQK